LVGDQKRKETLPADIVILRSFILTTEKRKLFYSAWHSSPQQRASFPGVACIPAPEFPVSKKLGEA